MKAGNALKTDNTKHYDMQRIISFLTLLLLSSSFAFAQKQVTGVIKDKDGPAIGVAIIEKDVPNNGAITDVDGQFKITLKGTSDILVVKGVGYITREITVGGRSVIEVTVEQDTKGLGEVIVIGYGQQRKITMTGAASTISGKEIRQNPSASLQNTLAGRLPGFTAQQRSGRPGGDGADFFIRGISSFNGGSTRPLIIVDDIEFTYDQFARLDPNEVESLTILKDAATTAVYGVKGANGVVVVTTQRGKSGPPKISVRGEGTMMQPTRMASYLNSYEVAKLYNQARKNDGQPDRWTAEDIELFRTGEDPYGHPDNDWKKLLFKDYSKQLRGNLDVAGGTEKVKYFISLGYLFQDGLAKDYASEQGVNNNYFHKRYNYRSNLDMKLTNTLDARIDLYGNVGQVNTPQVGSPFGYNDVFYDYSTFRVTSPMNYPIKNPNGTWGYSNWQIEQGPNYNNAPLNNLIGRMSMYGYNRTFENNMNLIGTANQKLDFITKGLSLKGTLAYTSNHSNNRNVNRDLFPSYIYNPANDTYTPKDPNALRNRRFFVNYSPGSTYRNLTMQAIMNYDRTFGVHHVYGLALYNQNTVLQFNSTNEYSFVPNNFRGFTGRLGYDYKDKYLVQFNAGYNGSDRFVSNKRYGFFPAASAGWNISEESFFEPVKTVVSRMKIRGSYGLVGNDNLGSFRYYYLQTYANNNGASGQQTSFGTTHNGYTGLQEGTLGNDNVTWEKETKTDVGLELEFFNGKVSFTGDYFYNKRKDIITNRGGVSQVFGQGLPPTNFGIMENKGYELELTYRNKIGKDFSYSVRGTYSYARNKILEMDEAVQAYPWMQQTGKSAGQIAVYQWTGHYYTDEADIKSRPTTPIKAFPGDLEYKDLNGDGMINESDRAVSGFPNLPNTIYGAQVGFNYKGLSFNMFFQGAANFNVRGVSESIQAFSSNLQDIHRYAWTPELGDKARYPKLSLVSDLNTPNAYPSTYWFVRGDYIRLKNVELGYTLPTAWARKIALSDVRVYANGTNLLTWTKSASRYEFDPEVESARDRVAYPPQRMYNFGINVTF